MPNTLQKAIGVVKDQTSIGLAKVNCSSNLQVLVLRATTHDDLPIDDLYIDEILHLISTNKIYAAVCARAIGRRITRTRNRVVALKSLMLVLRILQDGDPYFPREVIHATKRGARLLNLLSFQNGSSLGSWDYTAFVKTFGLYVNERLECFLTGKLQRRCKCDEIEGSKRFTKRSDNFIRHMRPAMLIDRIGYWQRLLKRAIATKPTGSAEDNQLVRDAVYVVARESFDLYKDVSDGLALLLDSFTSLKYELRVRALEICIKAEKQFKELDEFYYMCKSMGIGRASEYPQVEIVSRELIEELEEFLKDKVSDKTFESNPEDVSMAYPGQSEKEFQQEESCKMCESCSTRILPVTNPMIDILCLDDYPANEEQNKDQETNQNFFIPTYQIPSSNQPQPRFPPIYYENPILQDLNDMPPVNPS